MSSDDKYFTGWCFRVTFAAWLSALAGATSCPTHELSVGRRFVVELTIYYRGVGIMLQGIMLQNWNYAAELELCCS